MSEQNLHDVGDRIERLLAEVRSMASPSVAQRVDELMRSTVVLYGAGLARIMEIVAASANRDDTLVAALAKDDLVASLLILHGLHPHDFATRVHVALEKVRPYLGSHGGGVEIAEADERTGVVRLRMQGSCDGCPSTAITVKLAVEGAIKEMAPEVERIEVEGMPDSTNGDGHVHASSASSWIKIDSSMAADANVSSSRAADAPIVLCRSDGILYAYRDACPSCGAAMSAGNLKGTVLACRSCEIKFDIRLAGRAIDKSGLRLEPLPLIESDEGVRVAVSSM